MIDKSRWIQRAHLLRADEYLCPVCGRVSPKPLAACPKCGARLKGVKYDPVFVDEIENADAAGH